jgi:hypothetical protein
MIVSKLKDIYARKILGEQDDVKIFKQDPDQDAVEHIATLDKVYYNNVLKRALKANDVSGEEIDSILSNYQNLSFDDRNHLKNYPLPKR